MSNTLFKFGPRALQTSTTTGSAFEATHTDNSTSGSGGDSTDNNLFGGNGSAPLVPAFILTGFLLASILLMTWWRRVARPAGARMPFARVGGGLFYFPAAFDGVGPSGRGEREKVVGPKPEMFDVLVTKVDKKEREAMEEKGGLEWDDVKPLAAHYEPPPSQAKKFKSKTKNILFSNAHDRTTPVNSTIHPTFFSRVLKVQQPPTPSPSSEKEPASSGFIPPAGHMHISVLIAMPSPFRPRHVERHSSETVDSGITICDGHPSTAVKGKEPSSSEDMDGDETRLGELDLMLGFTAIPYVAGASLRDDSP